MLLLTLSLVTTHRFSVPTAQKLPDLVSQAPGPDLPSSVGSPCINPVRLNVNQLESIAKELCKDSLAASSSKTYKSAQHIYIEFCSACRRNPIPTSEQLLILFVGDLSLRVYYLTVRTYLAVVRHIHIAQDYGDPLKGCPRLELVLKGLKRR